MNITVEKYDLKTNKLKKDIKLVLISDIHYMDSIADDYNHTIIKNVKELNPNYIVLGGDYFCGLGHYSFLTESSMNCLKHLLYGLRDIAPVIMMLGNHDLSIKQDKELREAFKTLKDKDIYPLDNETLELDDITFTSFFAHRKSYACSRIMKRKLKIIIEDWYKCNFKINNSKYNILLHHLSPTILDETIKKKIPDIYKYDLILSGHEHNGCYSPKRESKLKDKNKYSGFTESPINWPPFYSKICRGMHNINGTNLIISRGITSGIKWSIGNKLIINTNKEYSYITEIKILGESNEKK